VLLKENTDSYIDNYEDVSVFSLDEEREQLLHKKQTECVLMWTNSSGDPIGVVMNYVKKDGKFWLTCTRRRKRVSALEQRPRASIAVSSRGTDIGISQAVTYRGNVHIYEDDNTRDWFYRALAEKVRPDSKSQQDAFVEHLNTPGRVVIELIPDSDGRIGFDSEQMFANSPAGRSSHQN
tara:strand:- start:41962 stop:42498 length:537 start_codon:yes stop_codon:yes gene_type:complete